MLARALALCTAFALPLPAAAGVGLNLYGLAYHFDRDRAHELGLDNELIAGVGLRYRVAHSAQVQWNFDLSVYNDSGRNTAHLAGAGALWIVSERWRLGGGLAAFQSDSYNEGRAFITPLPLLVYEFRSVSLNVTFAPKLKELNHVATLAMWITWWP